MNLVLNIIAATVLAVRGLVIPVEFEDLKFSDGASGIAAIAEGGVAYFNREKLDVGEIAFDVSPIYSEPESFRKFGANSSSAKDALFYSAVQNACRKIDKETDFSKYEYILFAVPGMSEPDSGEEDRFWPQASSLAEVGASIVLDGKKIDRYAVFCELGPDGKEAGIGDFLHETGHLLGLQDLYDTDGDRSGGLSPGLGGESVLMDTGNKAGLGRTPPRLCAAELDVIAPKRGSALEKRRYSLPDISGENGGFLRMSTSIEGRYYLIENRDGLAVTCIDKSDTPAGESHFQKRVITAKERWELNEINCRPDRMCAESVVCGLKDPERCVKLDSLAITDIRPEDGGSISFTVIEPVALRSINAFQDCAIIEWESGIGKEMIKDAEAAWWADGEKLRLEKAASGRDGRYSAFLKGLKSATQYFVSLRLTTTEGETFQLTSPFTTRSIQDGVIAFILIPSEVRNPDGSFKKGSGMPLIVYNAVGTEDIKWTFNGIPVGKDGSFTVEGSGILKAVISYSDGSSETIIKRINVK